MQRSRERWSDRAGKTPVRADAPCKYPGCNTPFVRKVPSQEFCKPDCRKRYDALAQTRARGVYESLRDWYAGKGKSRKDDPAKLLSADALTFTCREVARWRDEDAAMRKAATNKESA